MPRAADVRAKLKRTRVLLERMYGPRPARGRGRGLDVLVEAMLAQNTSMPNATRGYKRLRRAFPSWNKVRVAPVDDVQARIAICGLARMRARRLQTMLNRIKAERGNLSIEFLNDGSPDDAAAYLTGFHGIGPKTAAFVLLFAFGMPVLPVDNGVLRVVRRLRLVRQNARDAEAERRLSPLIAKGRHYATHLLLFAHAKHRCRPKNPKCQDCLLLPICPHGQRRVRHKPPAELVEIKLPVRSRPASLARFASAGIVKDGERSLTTNRRIGR